MIVSERVISFAVGEGKFWYDHVPISHRPGRIILQLSFSLAPFDMKALRMTALKRTIELFARRHALHILRPVASERLCRSFTTLNMSSTSLDINAPPAADQHIFHMEKEYTTVKEGLAYILIPASASKTPQTTPQGENQAQSVFYNPIQQFNRDLSVLAIKAYGEEATEKKIKASIKAAEVWKKRRARQKDKKRKREVDGIGSEPRKAGKVEDNGRPIEELPAATNEKPVDPTAGINTGLDAQCKDPLAEHKDDVKAIAEEEASFGSKLNAAQDVEMANSAEASELSTTSKTKKAEFKPSFTILDALSATGLRALRYAHEIPFTTAVTANDLLETATETIKLNVEHNKLGDKITAITGNALTHMYTFIGDDCKDEKGNPSFSAKYDVIDLDPYGTAAPFIDAAVQAVRDDGGLLCVTCTDAGVWASNGYPEKAFSLYGGTPMKGVMSHEGGLRLILHTIATSAARYGLTMEPLLSLSIDFYARVFVRINKSPAEVKFLAGKTMVINNCDEGCGAWTTQTIGRNKLTPNKNGKGFFWKHVFGQASLGGDDCPHCGMKTHLAGPMYAGPIHSPEFIKKILADLPNVSRNTYKTTDRIEGMLNLALEEVFPVQDNPDSPTTFSKTKKYDHSVLDPAPFFFIPSALSKVIHCVTPHEDAFRGALRHLGYWVTRSHCKPGSMKTNAPWDVVWEVMREWTRQKAPVKNGAIRDKTAGWQIMGMDKEKSDTDGSNETDNGVEAGAEKVNDTPTEKEKFEVVFDEKLGREKDTRKLVRYQLNPRENWGPMNRAKGHA
jgi:tRNA (guanine26-N2/guanine27-N2)-dimethyltransferase